VFCGVCLRRNIPDGLKLVEYAAENRKRGEYINRLLEKVHQTSEKREANRQKSKRGEKKRVVTTETANKYE
jgi:2,3-bisphosphoglycerate-independent phosphoglycerate mutase